MKAIVKNFDGLGLNMLDIKEPSSVGENEVIVEIDAVSICGTDLHIYNWDSWAKSRIKIPRIIGHEGTGKIVEVGKNVSNLKIGQRISFESHIPCFECYQCKTGKMNICSNLRLLGVDVDGLFRKYICVPSFIAIPNDLGYEAAILEPLGNAFHCLQRVDVSGKYIGILGDGPIAIFLFYYAQKFGAAKIFLVGASKYRMNIAKNINSDDHLILDFFEEDVVGLIRSHTKGRMLDVVFEMAGSKSTIELGLNLLTFGGKFVAFGILPDKIELDYNSLIFKAIDIISINGRIIFDSWLTMLDVVKKEDLQKFITHYIEFKDYQKAFSLLLNKEALKIIIKL